MLIQSISQIKHNKIQSNSKRSNNISQKTVNNVTLPSFADAKSFVNINFKGVIHNYARDGYAYLVLEKIEEGVSVNDRGTDYNTPLIVACDNGKTKVVEKLLEHPDIDVNARNVHGTTALMAVCRSKSDNTAIAEKLLNRPEIDVNIKNRDKNTALIWACCAGKTKIVEKLIDIPNIDVNAQNALGGTALMFAAFWGFADIAEKILKHPDVDVNLKDNKGKTASDYADAKIAGMIKSYQKGIDKRGVNNSSVYNLQKKTVADVNLQDEKGNTPLIWSSIFGKTEEVKELLKNPDTNINAQNIGGNTSLMLAIHNKQNDVTDQLLANPYIDVNIQNKQGVTALMFAAVHGDVSTVQKLLQKPDIDVNIKDEKGRDAIYFENANNKSSEDSIIAKMIKDFDAGVNKRVIEVVQGGNRKDSEGTVAEVNKPDKNGNTPLMLASIFKNMDKIDELLKDPEVDVNARGAIGCTALMCASNIGNRNAEVVEKLLQHPDINVNAQSSSGWTALHWACNNNYEKVVEKLLEHPDIDVNIKDGSGRDASSFANDEIVQMIKNYRRGVDKRVKVLPRVLDFNKFVSSKEFSTEEIENAVRRSVTKKIREEERIKANKKVEDKIAELDKTKAEYEEKNKALDNLINDYNSMLADDVEDAKSGFRTLYGVKSENLPENMELGEQMIYVIDIMNNNKKKLINMNSESPEKITKTLQDNNGNISNDGLKFLERILQVSDKSCSEEDLISAINSVKNKNGYIDMKKVSYFIANLSWGQSTIPEVIQKVEQYAAKNN